MPGYEADDIIGTLAQSEIQHEDVGVLIVSSDKDLKQLVTDRVTMYDAMKEVETTPQSFLHKH
jgi:DNA polymerase-1